MLDLKSVVNQHFINMPPKKKIKKVQPKSLTKSQMKGLINNLKSYTGNQPNAILKSISNSLKDDPCLQSKEQKTTVGLLLNSSLITTLCDGFLDLYQTGNKGRIMDKYALFQIKWSEFLCESLKCGTNLNNKIIPDNISGRKYDKKNRIEHHKWGY